MQIRLKTRLWGSFFLLVGALALASAITLTTLSSLDDIQEVALAAERAKHHGHKTAALTRDLYIHQAHTVLGDGLDHLEHYEATYAKTRDAAARLVEEAARFGVEAPALVAGIEAVNTEFRRNTLVAMAAGDTARALTSHAYVQRLVDGVIRKIEAVNAKLESHADASRASAVEASDRTTIWIVSTLCGATLLAILLGIRVTRSVDASLARLASAAHRIQEGHRDHRVAEEGDVEIAELAAAFNRMADEIARNEERLVESRKLAGLGRIAAGVAHEINNPLTVVLGHAKLLRERISGLDGEAAPPDASAIGADLDIIVAEAEQCRRIVSDLRAFGQTHVESPRPLSVSPFLEEAIVRVRATSERLDGEDLDISLNASAAPAEASAPVGRLRQIIDNLLHNAVDASRGRIAVTATSLDGDRFWELVVEDDGTGIPAEHRPKLFEPFFTTKPSGTGLGLAISLAMARAMGGDLRVENGGDLGGARFVLTLPSSVPAEYENEHLAT